MMSSHGKKQILPPEIDSREVFLLCILSQIQLQGNQDLCLLFSQMHSQMLYISHKLASNSRHEGCVFLCISVFGTALVMNVLEFKYIILSIVFDLHYKLFYLHSY